MPDVTNAAPATTTRPYVRPLAPGMPEAETTAFFAEGAHTHRRIAWGAIFGGVVLVIAIELLLSMLGVGVGLDTINVNAGTTPTASSLGMGAGIWWVVSSWIALFIGGYIAGWLAGIEIHFDGMLHGLVTWGLASLITVYLLTSAIGSIIGGGFSIIGGVASTAGSGISSAAKPMAQAAGMSPAMMQDQAQAYLQPQNPNLKNMTPQDAQKQVATNLVIYGRGGADAPAAKERIIDIMSVQENISRGEAAQHFDATEAKFQQDKEAAIQDAKNAADKSAGAASMTSFAAFVMLLIGAILAAIGGSLAVQRRLLIARREVA